MTAVIGILNKRGAAIAADSAVTRQRRRNSKVTKNGNKMIRLSDVDPISVMITGNGRFCETQWDIIVRHYRQHQGVISHETVEACVHDFFKFLADNHLFCDKEMVMQHIEGEMNELFARVHLEVDRKFKRINEKGILKSPKGYQKAFLKILAHYRKKLGRYGASVQFQDYSIEQFDAYAGDMIREFLKNKCHDPNDPFSDSYPKEIIDAITDDFELTLMTLLTNRRADATLVFTGFGTSQKYPSLVSVAVFEGFDDRVNYHIRPEDIVCISDDQPVAICPFAQDDVVNSILDGIYFKFRKSVFHQREDCFSIYDGVFGEEAIDSDYEEFFNKLEEIDTSDLSRQYCNVAHKHFLKNRSKWEKALVNYDLQAMAALAHSLIDLTGFYRIIHFEQEGVGGPVDLAVITKNEGFTWLNRKSWFHHKDIGGQYGVLGV